MNIYISNGSFHRNYHDPVTKSERRVLLMTRAQHDTPMSDSKRKEAPNSSSTHTKKTPRGSISGGDVKDTPEYEKQRLSRIAENRKRMEALGLAKLATSFMDSSKTLRKIDRKGKRKFDEDYNPGEDSSNSEDDDSEEGDEGFGSENVSRSRGMKVISLHFLSLCTFTIVQKLI